VRTRLIFLIITGLFVSAQASTAAAADLKLIRVAHGPTLVDLPFSVAKEAGLFQKYGLNLDEIIRIPTHDILVANAVDCTVAPNVDRLIRLRAQGFETRVLATVINLSTVALIVRDDFPEDRAVDELKKGPIGVYSSTGGSGYAGYLKAMKKLGIDPKSPDLVETKSDLMIAGVKTGRLKAAVFEYALIPKARKAGLKVLLDLSGEPYPVVTVACRKDFIDRNPDMAENLLKVMVEATYLVKTDKQLLMRVLKTVHGVSEVDLREWIADFISRVTVSGSDMAPQDIVALAADDDLKTMDEPRIVDLSFLKRLDASGFFDKFPR